MKDNKPKALVFYTYLPPWRIDVFNEMAKYYELTIVFLNADCEGFTYNRELLLSKLRVKAVFWNKGFNIGSKPFRRGIHRMLKEYKPDVVFSHEYSPTSIVLATFIRMKLFHFKLVITTSDNLKMAESVSGLKKYFRSFVLKQAKGVVVYSDSVRDWYRQQFSNIRVEVCPNIQDPKTLLSYKSLFKPIINEYKVKYQLTKPVVLYVGRLEEVKGIDLLIQAFSCSLKGTHQLVLVGDGSQKELLKALIGECQMENDVILPGYFDGANLYAWYALSHYFVLPSRYEPFGAVVNEALVLGCPVLASKNIGALDYIREGWNGFIFDPENRVQFIETLLKANQLFPLPDIGRENLMQSSFEDYVNAFKMVAE